jgi:hypothetical protein
MAQLDDGRADAMPLEHFLLRLAQDGFRKGGRTGAEIVYA